MLEGYIARPVKILNIEIKTPTVAAVKGSKVER